MGFDIGKWAEGNLKGAQRRGASYEADCPFCGKRGHLYLHAERGYWTCFAGGCGRSGRNIARLMAEVEGIPVVEAYKKMLRGKYDLPIGPISPERTAALAERVRRLRLPSPGPGAATLAGGGCEGNQEAPDVAIALPKTMVPVWDGHTWRMPKYLIERGLTRRLAVRYGLGFCGEGLCDDAPNACQFPDRLKCVDYGRCRYAHRIILPIECPGGRSFTARSVDPSAERKYLNPPAPKGKLLFGWNQAVKPGGELVIVEGPFDVLRLASHGIGAVAVMGITLARYQRRLLISIKPSTITVMLDGGVEARTIKIANDMLGIAHQVFIASLPDGIDPGEADKTTAWNAIRNARRYTASRADMASSLLRRLTLIKNRMDFPELVVR